MPKRKNAPTTANPNAAAATEVVGKTLNGLKPGQSDACAPTDLVRQLAGLVVDIDQKSTLCANLERKIEPIRRLKMIPVDGEIGLLQKLTGALTQAKSILQTLQAEAEPNAVNEQLAALQAILADGQWATAAEYIQTLDDKQRRQEQAIQTYREQLTPYQQKTALLRAAVEQALNARAPRRKQTLLLTRLESLLMTADRALRGEQAFSDLITALKALAESVKEVDPNLQQITETTRQTEKFSRQADLLLLQSPLDQHNRFQYAILLRTPSEPGAHGINVHDTSTLIQHDWKLMKEAIGKITIAVEKGLVRSAQPAAGPVPTPQNNPAPPETVTPVTRAALRRFVFGDEEPDSTTLLNGTDLVREMGDLMYRLFMPEQMQQYLHDAPCSITLTTNDLELPWEFMYYGDNSDADTETNLVETDVRNFLCLSRPVARMPMGRTFPIQENVRQNRPPKRQFLLICSDPNGDLPGARREIQLLQQWLETEWKEQIDVEVLDGANASGKRLNQALRSDKYDVIHYSGHAFFDDEDPDLSGLLLYDQEIFFAQKVRRMLEGRPLVFLNACQSALTANEQDLKRHATFNLDKPATGLASSFIYGGALGCIGSLWPIYDEPAARFAIEFYKQVLEGHMLGEAMRMARCEIKKKDPITWAAFVLYGDPTFRLVE